MKAGSCSVCAHSQRAALDQAAVSGASIRDLAKRFDRNKDTIAVHLRRERIMQRRGSAGCGGAGELKTGWERHGGSSVHLCRERMTFRLTVE